MQDTNKVTPIQPSKGLITDLHEDLVPGEYWTHARNATIVSHIGQANQLQSEASPVPCVDLPYTPIGWIRLLNNKWIVFTTDDTESEIGIVDESKCTYTKVVNTPCLGFNKKYLIEGASKELSDCSEAIYWTDGFNPRRYLKLNEIPYKYSIEDDACETKVYTNIVDCDELLLDKKLTVPKLTVRKSAGGELRNGVYQFGIAYADNGQRISDYYSITNPQTIFTHENYGQGIDVEITSLDRDFDEYELIAIYTINGVTEYKSLGIYSTATERQHISSVTRPEYVTLDIKEIVIRRPKYVYADGVEANDQYLLWHGVTTDHELSYQLQAMNIQTKYVVYEVPADYYKKGGNKVGYMRDEIYAFGIQWLRDNGEWTPTYHIPGSDITKIEGNAAGRDVYELSMRDHGLSDGAEIPVWRVKNTATPLSINETKVSPTERIVGYGEMAYWESTRLYPDNEAMFGTHKCTPIRHHKLPDNCATHIYSNNGNTIRILGIQFENIEHPIGADRQPVKGIKGYRIVRSDRRGNKSVVAKGVFTNVRAYRESNGQDVLYANYPFNDLRQDSFLSSKEVYFNSGERDFRPLAEYKTDQFNFYSPDTQFEHISLGREVCIYTEEHSTIRGYFEEVYKHPKAKLLTQFDLYFALILGALDGYYAQQGKRCVTKVGKQDISLGLGAGVIQTPSGPSLPTTIPIPGSVAPNTMQQACDDALEFTSGLTVDRTSIRGAERVLRTLARVGVFAYFMIKTANTVLDIIANASPWQQYGLQYNSHGLFNSHTCVPEGNRRRFLSYYQYLFDGLNTVEGVTFNNYKREDSVYLKINDPVRPPAKEDNSRNTLGDLNMCGDIKKKVTTNASLYYGAIKNVVPDQYGGLDSINYLDTGYIINELPTSEDRIPKYNTDAIFGGDTYVNKMSVKRSHHFFSQHLHDVPDGYGIDYKLYRNVGHPRYWIDTNMYDLSNFINARPRLSRTPRQKHNLSCQSANATNGVTVVKDRYFYLFNSGVLEFFAESEINLACRDWKEKNNFYSENNSDLSTLFRSDKIEDREEFVYDRTYSKQLVENSIDQQRLDYDPVLASTCYQYHKNRVIYSLPSHKDQKRDNWKVYLTNNYYDFPMSEFGSLTTIHAIDNQQLMFLFDKAAPYVTIGRDELKLDGSGTKITIGDAGLFAREPRPVAYTDFQYGNCQSKWAFVNTQFGSFYPSQRQGRLFDWTGKLDEISRRGMHYWCKQYMPSRLLEAFPEYKHGDNPVLGVGMLSAFDNTNEIYYLSKRDYTVKDSVKEFVSYNKEEDQFYLNSSKIDIGDPDVFDDVSWTLSYSPKDQFFISWHDWHPDWTLQGETRFMSVKGNTLYKHNINYSSFSRYYGVDYPYEIGLTINSGGQIDVLRSIEYHLQVGKYYNNGKDFHHVLDDNFDYATVYNSEQLSGKMKMHLQSKKDLSLFSGYPRMDSPNDLVHILYNKEEHRYRINQFADIVKDRGEFTDRNFPLMITQPNGYVKEINQRALDYNKPVQHRKKFRHKLNQIVFVKDRCAEKNYIFNFGLAKQSTSFR